jgi:catechol 2,3-dioxygenase-like lactoylglutathione lyase family enzyme
MEFTIHPELPAQDIRRARNWYKEKLGLDPVTVGGKPFDPSVEPGDEELLYDTGTARFGVYQTPHAGRNLATAARLVASDFDAAHAELQGNGVEFEIYEIEGNFHSDEGQPHWERGALVFPDGEKTAWFKDSEGNILALGSS